MNRLGLLKQICANLLMLSIGGVICAVGINVSAQQTPSFFVSAPMS